MKLSDIRKDLRPRERLMLNGAENLNDYELLALVIGNGSKNENVLDLSKRLITKIGLKELSKTNITGLTKIKGIGKAKATRIVAGFELAKRAWNNNENLPILNSAEKIANIYMRKYSGLNQEKLILLCLDSRMRLMKEQTIFIGSIDTMIVHPREIYNVAIRESSKYIIIVHNHPSGNPNPSQHDIDFTKQLENVGKIIGIELLDHLIIAENDFYSFKIEKVI